jgi:hypothetical protein
MVQNEIIDGKLRTWSDDATKDLQKVGTEERYNEAIDAVGYGFKYIEVDKPVEEVEDNA